MFNIKTAFSTSISILPLTSIAITSPDLSRVLNATDVLNNEYYNRTTGLWQNFWWNSGAILSTIGDVALLLPEFKPTAEEIFANTFAAAKALDSGNFLNEYYDDEGWWAMGWIKAYDVTKDVKYLHAAREIHTDLLTSCTTHCHGGGNWWSKTNDSLPSISAQLFLAVTASLANRLYSLPTPPRTTTEPLPDYKTLALTHATWLLSSSGLLSTHNTFSDGLSLKSCLPIGQVYSYNQGVILGALIELSHLTSNATYLSLAHTIASAGISSLATPHGGILTETGSEKGMDPTGAQFKGVFVRNVGYLNEMLGGVGELEGFLRRNAESVWRMGRDGRGRLAALWQGPKGMSLSAASQGSGVDCLVAAAAAAGLEGGRKKGGVVVHGGVGAIR